MIEYWASIVMKYSVSTENKNQNVIKSVGYILQNEIDKFNER